MLARSKLEAVGRRARRLLWTRRLGQALLGGATIALALALVDFGLRLPGWLRLAMGLGVVAFASWWVVSRGVQAWAFAPSLSSLALRAEKRFPALRGVLASGLELAGPTGASADTLGAFAAAAAREADAASERVSFEELVEPRPARRALAAGAGATLLLAGLVALAPSAAATAAARWLQPFGDAAWPLRYAVAASPLPAVLPAEAPVVVEARVSGPNRDTRAWGRVRFEDVSTGRSLGTEEVLLAAGRVEEPGVDGGVAAAAGEAGSAPGWLLRGRVQPPPAVLAALRAGAGGDVQAVMEVAVGDATSPAQTRPVRLRPALASATATVIPPAYAVGLVPERSERLDLSGESLGRLSVLRGSSVELALGFNRPLPREALASLLPSWNQAAGGEAELGFAGQSSASAAVPSMTLRFGVNADATATLGLRDGPRGDPATLAAAPARTLSWVATADEAPRARVAEPAVDEVVLATARLPVAAAGSDDLQLAGLRLEAAVLPGGAASDEGSGGASPQVLAESGAVGRELEARSTLAVASLGVRPGDTVVLHAVARAPGLDGVVEVRSAPRVLRVVDASELLETVRRELAAVRREARGLADEQARLRAAGAVESSAESAPALQARQARLARASEAAARRLEAVAERLARNAAGEEELDASVAAASDRLAAATAAAAEAAAGLEAQALSQAEAQAQAQARAEAQSQSQSQSGESGSPLNQAAEGAAADPAAGEGGAAPADANAEPGAPGTPGTPGDPADPADPADPGATAAAQAAAEENLRAAADLLDAGGDAAALRLDARALRAAQEALRDEAAELLLQTAGERLENLPAEERQRVEELAADQAALAERAEDLLNRLRDASADPGDSAQEQAASAAMAQAARAAARAGLTPAMEAAAEAAGENQLSGAGEAQQDALAALEDVLEAFEGQAQRRRDILEAKVADLLDRVKRIRETAGAGSAQLDAAVEAAVVVGLAEPLSAVWERTLAAAAAADEEAETRPAQAPLTAAAGAQLRGVAALRAATRVPAQAATREALASLDAAIAELEATAQAQAQQDAAEERARLRGLYTALAERQRALADQVEPLAQGVPGRRARAELRAMAQTQEEMVAEAAALEERAGEGAAFAAVHAEVEEAMTRAAVRLRTGDAVSEVPVGQRQAGEALGSMADALVAPPRGNDFQDGAGGGGGGGGGSGAPEVPAAAQVKLLRSMQARLLAESVALRQASDAGEPVSADDAARLVARQRRLLDLGRQLAEQVERNAPQARVGQAGPDAPGDPDGPDAPGGAPSP